MNYLTHKQAFAESAKYFPTPLQAFQYTDKYSRFNYGKMRRETWIETVDRAVEYLRELSLNKLDEDVYDDIHSHILNMQAMPSMRLLAMAGEPARRNGLAIYNCSAMGVDSIDAFVEALIISMSGCGVGFSVEDVYVSQLPIVQPQRPAQRVLEHTVEDSAEGWADALRLGLEQWFAGFDVTFDLSLIRPAGAILKTKGGRACLTGDTVLYKDRKKSRQENTITIQELFEKSQKTPRRIKLIKIRSMDEQTGVFYRNRVVGVVDNGIAPVYKVTTENGYTIKATSNHRFMNDSRKYQYLSRFAVGDRIAVNGKEIKTAKCIDCECMISRRSTRCKVCYDKYQTKDDALGTTARQRKPISNFREYKSSSEKYCEACGDETARFEVHHIDGNPQNNDWSNLVYMCPKCHQNTHAIERAFGDPYKQTYVSFDRIVSIEYMGEERVYDLQMQAPNHNFVANGFVSHNSGPSPLQELLNFARQTILKAQGRRLMPLEAHDLMCEIGNAAVQGGVRRTAMISLFDHGNYDMNTAKHGDFNPRRWNANNSVVIDKDMTHWEIENIMRIMHESGRGEPGFFSRIACENTKPARRKSSNWLTNPCAEIVLMSNQLCNLSIVVARPDDTPETLRKKVGIAAIIGTIQSMSTHFPGLRPIWKQNCEDERLLGVDITGQMDCPLLQDPALLRALRDHAVAVNKHFAAELSINQSAAVTCVKPSGNSAALLNCSSGLHARHSPYYIRRVRVGASGALYKVLRDAGVPLSPENGQTAENATTWVASFPIAAPEGTPTKAERTAIDQLEYWKHVKLNWCEHSPSATIGYDEHELPAMVDWLFENQAIISGLSFLQNSDAQYEQMPYEEISREQYEAMAAAFPFVDWSLITEYESEDYTEAAATLSCMSGLCEVGW